MKKLSPEALSVLDCDVIIRGSFLSIEKPLDRKLYVEVNAALEALGGKWDRRSKAHIFSEDPVGALDQVLVDGGFHDKKQDLQQFFTPTKLASDIVARANVANRVVLEPSAGEGSLVREALKYGPAKIVAVEKDPKLIGSLVRLVSEQPLPSPVLVVEGDFLQSDKFVLLNGSPEIERVVMNPPFTRQQDIDHVVRAHSLLTKGGLLVAIMSAGTEFRENHKARAFRDLVLSSGGSIERLPDDSFVSSGTSVRTVLVTMRA